MKQIFHRLACALTLSVAVIPAEAVIYTCQVEGSTVFTEKKIGNQCSMQNSPTTVSETPVAEAVKKTAALPTEKSDDIKILPSAQEKAGDTQAAPANPRINVKLRNAHTDTVHPSKPSQDVKSAKQRAAELNRQAKIKPAPIIMAPAVQPKPQLTRKQILQNEIRNERAALARAKAQLNVARKKGDSAKINHLTQNVRDREANIRAIQGAISR